MLFSLLLCQFLFRLPVQQVGLAPLHRQMLVQEDGSNKVLNTSSKDILISDCLSSAQLVEPVRLPLGISSGQLAGPDRRRRRPESSRPHQGSAPSLHDSSFPLTH
ncbi:hypothetical protein LZ30DRAFT_702899 [Colletotrichum cereale]|nr:hypothetical protein LZ30DRAFT_702899 [Colletotrichum cereale]